MTSADEALDRIIEGVVAMIENNIDEDTIRFFVIGNLGDTDLTGFGKAVLCAKVEDILEKVYGNKIHLSSTSKKWIRNRIGSKYRGVSKIS